MLGIPRPAERYTPLPITAMHESKDYGTHTINRDLEKIKCLS